MGKKRLVVLPTDVAFVAAAMRDLGCSLLQCIEDFVIKTGGNASPSDAGKLSRRPDALLECLGITRHPTKGVRGEGSMALVNTRDVFGVHVE